MPYKTPGLFCVIVIIASFCTTFKFKIISGHVWHQNILLDYIPSENPSILHILLFNPFTRFKMSYFYIASSVTDYNRNLKHFSCWFQDRSVNERKNATKSKLSRLIKPPERDEIPLNFLGVHNYLYSSDIISFIIIKTGHLHFRICTSSLSNILNLLTTKYTQYLSTRSTLLIFAHHATWHYTAKNAYIPLGLLHILQNQLYYSRAV